MPQTEATKRALERDGRLCQWCLENGVLRDVFESVEGYHPAYSGGHHILRRNRVDDERAIVGLCCEHHYNTEHSKEPTKKQLIDLMLKRYGHDLRRLWPEFIKE